MQPGTILPNGAKVLDSYLVNNDFWVYLCHWEGNYMPWVSWCANKWDKGATFAGSYHLTKEEATARFYERCRLC